MKRWLCTVWLLVAASVAAAAQSPLLAQQNAAQPAAQDAAASEPTREQLQLQLDIMRKYIEELEQRAKAAATDSDSTVAKAYRAAQLKQYESIITQTDIINQSFYEHRSILRISLALVALVVIAGVIFSGLQLWQSLKVASAPLANDLEISLTKIRLTSSVIGVMVLGISLAFFYVFFTANLKIERTGTPSPTQQSAQQGPPTN